MKGFFQIKIIPKFGGGERVKIIEMGTTGKEIDTLPAKFAGTTTSQDKFVVFGRFDEAVDFIEELGDFLDFIEYNKFFGIV